MKFRAALTLQPVNDLRKIAATVSDEDLEPLNRPALMDLLCTRFASANVVESCLDKLDKESRGVVNTIAMEGGDLPYSVALQVLGGGFQNRFDELLNSLTLAGLVFRDPDALSKKDPLVGIPETILKSIPDVETTHRLRSIMATFALGQLRAFATDLGISPLPNQKAYLVESIRDVLTDCDSLRDYIKSLPDDQRLLLDYCLSNN